MEKDKKVESKVESLEELKAKLAAAEAKLAAGEEAALERVCKAMNVAVEDVKAHKEPEPEQMVEMDIGTNEVRINGLLHTGRFVCSIHTKRVIEEAVSKDRMRLINELSGNSYQVEKLLNGAVRSRLIGPAGADRIL